MFVINLSSIKSFEKFSSLRYWSSFSDGFFSLFEWEILKVRNLDIRIPKETKTLCHIFALFLYNSSHVWYVLYLFFGKCYSTFLNTNCTIFLSGRRVHLILMIYIIDIDPLFFACFIISIDFHTYSIQLFSIFTSNFSNILL